MSGDVPGLEETLEDAVDALRAKPGTAALAVCLARVVGLLRDENEALRHALARVVRHEVGQTHAHDRAGVWDAGNRPGVAGEPCARCHDFADAREALGLARWPTAAEHRRWDDDLPPVCAHRNGCGCGESSYRAGPVIVLDGDAVDVVGGHGRRGGR